jgi:acyl-CoA synthetase (NDP forming)
MSAIERISRLLRPRSIAIAGASQAANKLAGQIIPMLIAGGYKGTIHPVNPRYDEVAGLRCHPAISAIPGEVDHCIIVVAKERVAGVLAECRAKGVASASIFSSGYAEAGESGSSAQAELEEAAGGMVFVGPNCMGFANLVDGVIAAPAPTMGRHGPHGNVALLSQSGGLAYATLAFFAREMGLGFSHVVNTGNSAGVSFADLVEFMFDDAATRVVMVVAESERTVAETIAAVRKLGLRKPIVLLKLGRGATGVRMALSHTGSLAGDYGVIRDCAEQAGIVCADDVDDALGLADLLRRGFSGRHADGLAAICISGGNVTLFADQADAHGLEFAELSDETEAGLRRVLPDYISVHNPIDITALGYEEPALHTRVIDVLVKDAAVRTMVPIITTAVDYTPVCSLLAEMKARNGCPMIVLWTGGSYENRSPEILREAQLPIFRSAGTLARCLAALKRSAPARDAEPVRKITAPALPRAGALTESESLAFLEAGGVPVPAWRRAGRGDLAAACAAVGYPVAIKADVTETHISDRGGVILGISDEADLARNGARIAALPGEALLVSRFLPGQELVASTFRHPLFGPLLMVGSGGILVELLKDVRFLALPADHAEIERALTATAVGRGLRSGHRGATGFAAAVEFLERLVALALAAGDAVTQIELNPVTVGGHGAAAVDASVIAAERK